MKKEFLILLSALSLLMPLARAGSGTWFAIPVDNNWNNPSNWSSGTVPNDSGDVATFNVSGITGISVTDYTTVGGIVFSEGADSFAITNLPSNTQGLWFAGDITNESGMTQNLILPSDETGNASFVVFYQSARAGDQMVFTIKANPILGSIVPAVAFESRASAGSGTFVNEGGTVTGAVGGHTNFFDSSNAGSSTIINGGGQVSGAQGGSTLFQVNNPSAANATIIANGGAVNGAGGALISFYNSSLAENATLIANAGVSGGAGGAILFLDASDGGTARVEIFGNGNLDLRQHSSQPPVTIGSLEGDGLVFLGRRTLTIGGRSLSTSFSGAMQGDGSVVKAGAGTLTLSGANLYLGGTTVTQGTLVVSNTSGSGTGTGPLNVNAGTLGGSGIIAGAVTIGTGSGMGAFLTPGIGTNKQTTLTIQSALTFNSDATYTYSFKAKKNKARTDLVIANGATINTGASFNLSGQTQGTLKQGLVLTVISNTSANSIAGTFSNLADGAIVNVNGNNLQASYSGGDGNDLTLTVVP